MFDKSPTDADITLIYGEPLTRNEDATLLVMRFHNTPKEAKMTEEQRIQFYKLLTSCCGYHGFEKFRKGGSSGRISYNKNLMKFLALEGGK